MDRKIALIIKEQIVGSHNGHMAAIPFNPVLHSMFEILVGEAAYPRNDEVFAKVLREVADALDPPKGVSKEGEE